MTDVTQTDFYRKVYDGLYSLGYHGNPSYSHSYGLIEYLCRELKFRTVLDVGASVGAAVAELNRRGKDAMGLDTSLVAVDKADELGRPVLWGDATKLPFPSNHIDCVMSTDVFEHLRPGDVDTAISECFRVARKYIAMKIATKDEKAGWGMRVGVPNLHLTVRPTEWWIERFLRQGGKVIYESGDTFVIGNVI